jgi:hypothetical protein
MAFFDKFKKNYVIKVLCYNCGHNQDCRVPKGNTIDSYLMTEAAICENCGNPTLRRIEMIRVQKNVQTPIKQYVQVPPPRMQQKPIRQQMPTQRPQRPVPQRPPQRQVQQQRVQYPVNEPVYQEPKQEQPDFSLGPKKINFWTGKEEGQ